MGELCTLQHKSAVPTRQSPPPNGGYPRHCADADYTEIRTNRIKLLPAPADKPERAKVNIDISSSYKPLIFKLSSIIRRLEDVAQAVLPNSLANVNRPPLEWQPWDLSTFRILSSISSFSYSSNQFFLHTASGNHCCNSTSRNPCPEQLFWSTLTNQTHSPNSSTVIAIPYLYYRAPFSHSLMTKKVAVLALRLSTTATFYQFFVARCY